MCVILTAVDKGTVISLYVHITYTVRICIVTPMCDC